MHLIAQPSAQSRVAWECSPTLTTRVSSPHCPHVTSLPPAVKPSALLLRSGQGCVTPGDAEVGVIDRASNACISQASFPALKGSFSSVATADWVGEDLLAKKLSYL